MEWYLPWTWNLDESTFAGMMGGLILGVCRLLLSLGVVARHHQPLRRYWPILAGHLTATLLFGFIGGTVAWALQGKAGDFISGVTALVTIVVIGGKMMPADTEDIMNTPAGPHV